MKGDFSRLPYPFQRRYSGVWMQQGRVQLDSDWNEQRQIAAEITRTGFRDAFGEGGAPRADAGFRIYVQRGLGFGDGAAVVVEAVDDACAGGEPFEIELWVERGAGQAAPATLAAVRGGWRLGLDARGAVTFRIGQDGPGAPVLVSPAPLEPGSPALVAAAWNGETATLTIDGELAHASRIGAHPAAPAGEPLTLAAARGHRGELEQPFTGTLSGVRLWRGAGRRELAGEWPLDDGGGAAARDTSGNGRHARLTAGGCGCPEWRPPQLWIGPGRYWVDGVLCENPRPVRFCAQPDYPGAPQPAGGDWLLYLDAWERYLGAAEDPAILEVALGGPDTTGRTRTIWQVRAQPVLAGEGPVLRPAPGDGAALAARRDPSPGDAGGNRLYRVEVHGQGGPLGLPRPQGPAARVTRVTPEPRTPGLARLRLADTPEPLAWAPGQRAELYTAGMAADGPLLTVVAVREGGAELQVEGLAGGWRDDGNTFLRPVATFVWSRDNAWVALSIRSLDPAGGVVELAPRQPDPWDLAVGDWVEVSDDRRALLGIPGPLRRVASVDREALRVVLDAPLPPGVIPPAGGHPLLRRWDARPGEPAAVTVQSGGWTPLDDGVEVTLGGAWFRTGDYWTIPIRDAAADGIVWPGGAQGPAMLPPQGIGHARAPLALVRADAGHLRLLRDLRRIFAPLGENGLDGRVDGPLVVEGDLTVGGTIRGRLASGLVGTDALADGAVDAGKLGAHAVTASRLAPGAVTPRALADGAVTGAALAPGAVGWEALAAGSVGGRALMDGSVGSAALAAGAVGGDALQEGGVTAGKLARGAVTGPSLANGSVTLGKLGKDVGTVPAGCLILGERPVAPPGYSLAGFTIATQGSTRWSAGTPLPAIYPQRWSCVEAAGHLWAVLDGDGQVLLWNPALAAWRLVTRVPGAGAGFAVAAVGERIYLVGGTDTAGKMLSRVLAYDVRARQWVQLAPHPWPLNGAAAAAVGGTLVVTGGMVGENAVSAGVQSYAPSANAWTARAPMSCGRSWHGAAALDGTLYVAGGGPDPVSRPSAEAYDLAADAWSALAPLLTTRYTLRLAAAAGRVWAVGGISDPYPTCTADVECFDPVAGAWTEGPPLPAGRGGMGVASVSGVLYAVGGQLGDSEWTDAVDTYCPPPVLHAYRRDPPPLAMPGG